MKSLGDFKFKILIKFSEQFIFVGMFGIGSLSVYFSGCVKRAVPILTQ